MIYEFKNSHPIARSREGFRVKTVLLYRRLNSLYIDVTLVSKYHLPRDFFIIRSHVILSLCTKKKEREKNLGKICTLRALIRVPDPSRSVEGEVVDGRSPELESYISRA